MSAFGRLLRTMREELRESQADLARSAGFDHSFVSRLESGSRNPRPEHIDRITTALDLTEAGRQAWFAAAFMPPVVCPPWDREQHRALLDWMYWRDGDMEEVA
jgi:transcriptional regulator with XRE-family HTH domain